MSSLRDIFDDAHRRVCIAKQRNEEDRSRMWTGMNYPREMRQAVEKGFMVPLAKETPRVMGWYKFTEKGWAQYDHIFSQAPNYFDAAYQGFHISYDALTKTPEIKEVEKIATPTI
ncbi:hypothetical protein [Rhizobium sp. MHM7A]|uniref:hypothetical protein n=1 Tax=Rhizobium sp. MHM7A TaxID=2583233 RepID=UPI0011058DE6|nr:hypothetical protein [Rhizobium sp. MHM7A]TLX16396.1 hypothetical protein FFR93_03425 [Rhizobium sp. MHM7A]